MTQRRRDLTGAVMIAVFLAVWFWFVIRPVCLEAMAC